MRSLSFSPRGLAAAARARSTASVCRPRLAPRRSGFASDCTPPAGVASSCAVEALAAGAENAARRARAYSQRRVKSRWAEGAAPPEALGLNVRRLGWLGGPPADLRR